MWAAGVEGTVCTLSDIAKSSGSDNFVAESNVQDAIFLTSLSPNDQLSTTVKWFRVRVPVLSVAIVVTKPISSMALNDLTSAFCLAIRRMPSTKITDNATGKPSGTMDTLKASTNLSASLAGIPLTSDNTKTISASSPIIFTRSETRWSIFACTGLLERSSTASSAILPYSVLLPVSTTNALAVPAIT